MKKVLVCALLALVVAGSASANYLWQANATSSANTYGGNALQFGYQAAAATTGQDWTTAGAAYCAVATLSAGVDGAKAALNKIDKWTGSDRAPIYLAVWAVNDYGGGANFDIRFWLGQTNTTGGVSAKPLSVKVVYDPVGDMEGTILGTAPITTGGSQAAPKVKFNLPVAKTADPLSAGSTYILELSVPEPGSMIAMLSGLVGLVGFGIRRRK